MPYPTLICGRFLVRVTGDYVGTWEGAPGLTASSATIDELLSFDAQYSQWLRANGRAAAVLPADLWGRGAPRIQGIQVPTPVMG